MALQLIELSHSYAGRKRASEMLAKPKVTYPEASLKSIERTVTNSVDRRMP
jgi:hypothetical protein